MYYKSDWRYPEKIDQRYKYGYGKAQGLTITPTHKQYYSHNYYGIPINCGDHVNRERLSRKVPRARGQAST
jgi:hypothetical protein